MTSTDKQATHTPGPWSFRLPPEPVQHVSYWIDGPDGAPVADVKNRQTAHIEANARLIAAAPDLLAALEAAVGYFLNAGINLETGGTKAGAVKLLQDGVAATRSAIAKARAA